MSFQFHDSSIGVETLTDRLTELRDANAQVWVAGYNMPGYMPDSVPEAFDSFEDARDYVYNVASESVEFNSDMLESEPSEYVKSLVSAIKDQSDEFGVTIGNYHYFVSCENRGLTDTDEITELAELETIVSELKGRSGDFQFEGD